MEGGSLHQLRRGTPAKTRDPLQDAILGEYTGSPDSLKYGVLSEHGIRGHLSCSQTQSSQVFHMPWRERSFPLLTVSCMPERDLRQCHSSNRSRVQEVTALSYQRRPFFTFFFPATSDSVRGRRSLSLRSHQHPSIEPFHLYPYNSPGSRPPAVRIFFHMVYIKLYTERCRHQH